MTDAAGGKSAQASAPAQPRSVDSGADRAASVRFAVILPDGWKTLDLDPDTRDRSIDRSVKAAIGGGDQMARVRHETALAFRRVVHDAADSGAFFAATFTSQIGGLPLSASVLAFLVPLPVGDDGRPIGVHEMRSTLSAPGDEALHEAPSLVDLPVGRAVRARARVGAGMAGRDGEEPQVDTIRFYVPVAEWDVLLVLVFSTPSLPAADAFADVFDLLARTARWKLSP